MAEIELLLAALALVTGALSLFWLLRPATKTSKPRVPVTPAGAWKDKSWEAATRDCPRTGDAYLVVGVGFLGKRLVQALLDRGENNIRVLDVAPNPFLDNARIEYIRGDVTKLDVMKKACEGIDTVYSTFAAIRFFEDLPHQAALSERINIGGTENVIVASQVSGVRRLVYTSTANVATEPNTCHLGMTEDDPYISREHSHNHYTWTKAKAERLVRAANGVDGLQTVCVRPCSGVFGFGDRMMLEKAIVEKMTVIVAPQAHIDYVHVDNVVLGHLLAETALRSKKAGVAGEAFAVSNDEPLTGEELYLAVQHYYPACKLVYPPPNLLSLVARIVRMISWLTKDGVPLGELKNMTPAMLATARMTYTYNCEKARRVIGYKPLYTLDEAVQKTVDEYVASFHIEGK